MAKKRKPPTPEVHDEDEDEDASSDSFTTTSDVHVVVPLPHRDSKAAPIAIPLVLTAMIAAVFHFSLAPTAPPIALLAALAGVYGLFSALTVLRFKRKHDLPLLRPKSGDLTIATLVAGVIYGLAYAVAAVFMARGTPHEGWLFHVYMLLSGAFTDKRHYLGVAIFVIAGLEELSWRGIVLDTLEGRFGRTYATLATSILWALAHVPSVYRMSDPIGGLNPLLPAAAFGCSIVWCYLRYRTDRLAPSVLSHAIFSWAVVEFPLWRP